MEHRGLPPPGTIRAYLLAGGRSRRMGTPKARLVIDGCSLVERIATRLRPYVDAVCLVVKDPEPYRDLNLPIVTDRAAEVALVHGIHAALAAAGPPWRLLLACDMPDVDEVILQGLWNAASRAGAPGACARLPGCGELEPLPSLWHGQIASRIAPEWGFVARDWLRRAPLAIWDVPETIATRLVNLNDPEAWAAYRRRGPRESA